MYKIILILSLVAIALASPPRNGRIVGGGNAMAGQVPFQVSLRPVGANFHFAGGALISNQWVLSTAENLLGMAQNSVNIIAGVLLLSTNPGSGLTRRSDRIIIHANYNPSNSVLDNNIACVRASTTFALTQTVQPVFIVSTFIGLGVPAQVSGWGSTDPQKGPNSDSLRILSVNTVQCEPDDRDERLSMCARGAAGTGICTTDLGGPLFTTGLIGLASWHTVPCGSEPITDFYVRISQYRTWIGIQTGV